MARSARNLLPLKKLFKGDVTWSTRKVVLGWVMDTTTKTIQLSPHRVARLPASWPASHRPKANLDQEVEAGDR
jgi:hypothetical protein